METSSSHLFSLLLLSFVHSTNEFISVSIDGTVHGQSLIDVIMIVHSLSQLNIFALIHVRNPWIYQ